VRVLVHPTTPDAVELWQRLTHDRMTQPYIFDTGQERRLHFSWKATQSTLLRLQPDTLVSQYARKMMAFLLVNPSPRRILILGLGGGELVRFCHTRLPTSNITVVEIDPQVIALREEFQIPADGQRFRVVQADGAAYVCALREPVDALLVDAFDPRGIAPTLASIDFYRSAARNLADNGVMAMNFWGATDRYVENLIPAQRVFRRNLRLVNTSSGNVVLFASNRSLPDSITFELERRASRLRDILSLDFPHFLNRLCQGESIA
jgi:spermidine synthase